MTGRVCWTHGAKRLRSSPPKGYKSTVQNTNQKGRVCVRHRVRLSYICTFEGCTNNNVVKGGVCVTHDAKVKRCSFEVCTNQVVKAGVCITHGVQMIERIVLVTHGATKKLCSFDGVVLKIDSRLEGVCHRHCSEGINTNTK